jgi:hypothetical protein
MELFDGSLREESRQFLDFAEDKAIIHPAAYDGNDAIYAALTAAGEKNGTILAATVEDIDPVMDQVDVLNNMGLDCWVATEEVEMGGRDLKNAKIYATNDETNGKGELELPFDSGNHEQHQPIGEFLGYPQEEIESYEENDMWPKGYTFEDGEQRVIDYESETNFMFPAHVIANEHDYESNTRRKPKALIPYSVRDTEESLEAAVQKAESRYQMINQIEEEYDIQVSSGAVSELQ